MKKYLVIGALAMSAVTSINAQSLPISLNGPWIGGAGYERGLSTGNNLVYGYIGYNILVNTNTGLAGGLLVGEEKLWKGSSDSSVQSFSGGFQISYTLKPLQQIGLTFGTNITATVAGYTLMATPKDSSAPIGNVTGTSVTVDLGTWKGITLKIQGQLGVRTGQGQWDDKYLGGGLALSKDF